MVTASTDPIIAINTYVPLSLAVRAQASIAGVVAALLAEQAELHAAPGSASGETFAPLERAEALTLFPDVWLAPPWQPEDADRAAWLVADLHGTSLAGLLAALVEHAAGTDADGLVATDAMEYPKGSIPTALKHLAMRCRQASRRPMWNFASGSYSMPTAVADLFAAALAEQQSA